MDTGTYENPPKAVLMKAIQPTYPSNYLSLLNIATSSPAATFPIYFILYFAEMTALSSADVISFQVYFNGVSVSGSFIPSKVA